MSSAGNTQRKRLRYDRLSCGWRYTVPDHHADLLAALEGGDEGLVGDDVQLLDHLPVERRKNKVCFLAGPHTLRKDLRMLGGPYVPLHVGGALDTVEIEDSSGAHLGRHVLGRNLDGMQQNRQITLRSQHKGRTLGQQRVNYFAQECY